VGRSEVLECLRLPVRVPQRTPELDHLDAAAHGLARVAHAELQEREVHERRGLAHAVSGRAHQRQRRVVGGQRLVDLTRVDLVGGQVGHDVGLPPRVAGVADERQRRLVVGAGGRTVAHVRRHHAAVVQQLDLAGLRSLRAPFRQRDVGVGAGARQVAHRETQLQALVQRDGRELRLAGRAPGLARLPVGLDGGARVAQP
jgi:hypothetical protein